MCDVSGFARQRGEDDIDSLLRPHDEAEQGGRGGQAGQPQSGIVLVHHRLAHIGFLTWLVPYRVPVVISHE